MTRSRRFVSGLIVTYGYQAVVLITGLWLTPFFLRKIGQQDYGLWLVASQLLVYLSLMDFGIVALLPQQTAYATGRAGREKTDELPEIVGQTTRLVLYQLPFVAAVAAGLWFTLPAEWQPLRFPLLITLGGYTLTFPLRILPALLQGLQDLAFANGMQAVSWGISTTATVALVASGWGLYALSIGWLLGQVLLSPVFFFRLRRRFPNVLPRKIPAMSWHAARGQLGKGGWVTVAQMAQVLMSNTDILIIGKLLGPAAVVPYACTGKLAGVLANQAQILMQTATPGLCEVQAGESKERLLQALLGLNHVLLTFSGLIFSIVLMVNQWFVGWWVTPAQYGGRALTLAIVGNMLVVHWDTVAAYSVFCLGRQRRLSLTNLGNGAVTAGGALLLANILGPIGAPLGSMAGTCLVGLPLNLSAIARDTGIGRWSLVAKMIGEWAWRFGLIAAGVYLLSSRWSPRSILEAIAAAAVVGGAYSLMMLPYVMRSPLGTYLRSTLASLRRRAVPLSASRAVAE